MFYDRLKMNERGKTFLPSNVEGGKTIRSSAFWNSTKSFICGALAFSIFVLAAVTSEYPLIVKIGAYIGWIICSFFIIRFKILDEIYYKKSLTRRKKYDKSTSGINWGIIFTNEMPNGTSVGFVDGYIGCFVRLERGSIIGQPDDFFDKSLDAYSDFLKEINRKGYEVVIINTSELAEKDKRLVDLSETIKEETNPALRNLLIYDLKYMKDRAETTLFETDTILIYTGNYLLLNSIIEDSLESTRILLGGAYRDRYILNESEIIDLHKELNAVDYMDVVNAKVDMFEHEASSTNKLYISSIKLSNGNIIQLSAAQQRKLHQIYNEYLINGKQLNKDVIQTLINYNPSKVEELEIQESKPLDAIENLELEDIDLPDKAETTETEKDIETEDVDINSIIDDAGNVIGESDSNDDSGLMEEIDL